MTDLDLSQAIERLGLRPGDTPEIARRRYRELLRSAHPDVAASGITSEEATEATVEITEAFRVVSLAIDEHGCIPSPVPEGLGSPASEVGTCTHRADPGPPRRVDAQVDGDSISMDLPSPEAYAVLLDAGSRIGGIGYVDRALGLLEIIVRFEGGPSCSVLITLQGRAFGTEAFVTMESIEAAPTPPIEPVMAALLEEIEAVRIV